MESIFNKVYAFAVQIVGGERWTNAVAAIVTKIMVGDLI